MIRRGSGHPSGPEGVKPRGLPVRTCRGCVVSDASAENRATQARRRNIPSGGALASRNSRRPQSSVHRPCRAAERRPASTGPSECHGEAEGYASPGGPAFSHRALRSHRTANVPRRPAGAVAPAAVVAGVAVSWDQPRGLLAEGPYFPNGWRRSCASGERARRSTLGMARRGLGPLVRRCPASSAPDRWRRALSSWRATHPACARRPPRGLARSEKTPEGTPRIGGCGACGSIPRDTVSGRAPFPRAGAGKGGIAPRGGAAERAAPGVGAGSGAGDQSRRRSLMEVLARVCSSTRFTITAQ